jgi:hypothetical protein
MNGRIQETISFYTQIHTSYNQHEQRSALRYNPRRSVTFDYIGMNGRLSEQLKAMAYSSQKTIVKIPLWYNLYISDKILLSDVDNVVIDSTNMWQFRGCSYFQTWLTDDIGGEVYKIKNIYSDKTIQATTNLKKSWPKGTKVYPVAWGSLSSETSYSDASPVVSSTQIKFDLVYEDQAQNIPDQYNYLHDENITYEYMHNMDNYYNSKEILMIEPDWTDDISSSFGKSANLIDNTSGIFAYVVTNKQPLQTKTYNFVLENKKMINNFQRFFCRMRGKLTSFYYPTWNNDIELSQNAAIGDLILYAKFPGYYKYYASNSNRKSIIVMLKNKTSYILNLSGFSTDNTGTYGKIYLMNTLTKAINISDIDRISFMTLVRFNSDDMTTDYEDTQLAKVSIPISEVYE